MRIIATRNDTPNPHKASLMPVISHSFCRPTPALRKGWVIGLLYVQNTFAVSSHRGIFRMLSVLFG